MKKTKIYSLCVLALFSGSAFSGALPSWVYNQDIHTMTDEIAYQAINYQGKHQAVVVQCRLDEGTKKIYVLIAAITGVGSGSSSSEVTYRVDKNKPVTAEGLSMSKFILLFTEHNDKFIKAVMNGKQLLIQMKPESGLYIDPIKFSLSNSTKTIKKVLKACGKKL